MPVRPPLPLPPDPLQSNKTSSTNQRHPTLVVSRGDNPKDKSGLLDVKKGIGHVQCIIFGFIGGFYCR